MTANASQYRKAILGYRSTLVIGLLILSTGCGDSGAGPNSLPFDNLSPAGIDGEVLGYQPQFPLSDPRSQPSHLSVTTSARGDGLLAWIDKASDESSYLVERFTADNGWGTIGLLSANAAQFSDSAPIVGAQSCYRVTAFNAAISSEPSIEYCVTLQASGDPVDLCPDDPEKAEPGVCGCGVPDEDLDADNIMDCQDPCTNDPINDPDQDGTCGLQDNCPTVRNADQADTDGDGIGNACDSDYTAEAALLDTLRSLPPLPSVHYSWSTPPEHLLPTIDERVVEYARITHAICIYSSGGNAVLDAAVQVAKRINSTSPQIPTTIAIVHSPWHHVFPPDLPPTYTGPESQAEIDLFRNRLTEHRQWLAAANAKHNANVTVSALILDSERFKVKSAAEPGAATWNQAITAKYDPFYLSAKQAFPGAEIEWFERGMYQKPWFTLQEMGESFSCSLYWTADFKWQSIAFQKTYENAQTHGSQPVNAWFSLGCGWQARGDGYYDFNWNLDYPATTAWTMGAILNDQTYPARPAAFAQWTRVRHTIFFPGPLDTRSPMWGRHFVAYVRGANGLPDTP